MLTLWPCNTAKNSRCNKCASPLGLQSRRSRYSPMAFHFLLVYWKNVYILEKWTISVDKSLVIGTCTISSSSRIFFVLLFSPTWYLGGSDVHWSGLQLSNHLIQVIWTKFHPWPLLDHTNKIPTILIISLVRKRECDEHLRAEILLWHTAGEKRASGTLCSPV